ncbi:MAG TPA: hypothetical protein VI818_02105 [Candidatus Thermoplasmatota archaeon]|nr:hypothetical protein [Candidatus Thermoplasmatota archaeon]
MKAVSVAVLLLAASFAALASPVQAQSGTVRAQVTFYAPQDDNGRLMPEVELVEVPMAVTVTFPGVPGVCTSSYSVNLEIVGKPSYASVALNPSRMSGSVGSTVGPVYLGQAAESTRTFKATLFVSVTRDAPAFKDEEYRVKATVLFPANTNGCTFQGDSAFGATAIKNDYVPSLAVEPQIDHVEGERGVIPVDLTNFGNGPTRVDIEFRPEAELAFAILEAPPTHLESRASKGASAVYKSTVPIQFAVETPGRHVVEAVVRAVYDGAAEGTLTTEQVITFVATWEGSTESARPQAAETSDDIPELPGVAHLGVLVALLGAAWLRRRLNG